MIIKSIHRVHFGRSEKTNVNALPVKALGKDEAICLVSLGGDQICFVYRGFRGAVTHSEKLRRNRTEKWTPDMLAEYAKDAGLDISNLRLFDQWHGKKINTQTKRSSR